MQRSMHHDETCHACCLPCHSDLIFQSKQHFILLLIAPGYFTKYVAKAKWNTFWPKLTGRKLTYFSDESKAIDPPIFFCRGTLLDKSKLSHLSWNGPESVQKPGRIDLTCSGQQIPRPFTSSCPLLLKLGPIFYDALTSNCWSNTSLQDNMIARCQECPRGRWAIQIIDTGYNLLTALMLFFHITFWIRLIVMQGSLRRKQAGRKQELFDVDCLMSYERSEMTIPLAYFDVLRQQQQHLASILTTELMKCVGGRSTFNFSVYVHHWHPVF